MNFNTYIDQIRKGTPVLIYEPGEDEISMMVLADNMSFKKLAIMKRYASGDIGVFITHEIAEKLKLPFLHDVVSAQKKYKFKNIKKSSLSILIDHVKAETGSSNEDKLMLIEETARAAEDKNYERFRQNIAVPGHLKFFISAKGILKTRQGHTELNAALAQLSGLDPHEIVMVMCSLRNPDTGRMMSKSDLKKFSDLKTLPLVEKNLIIKHWNDKYGK